jgi:hypothetical protein
VTAVTIGGEEWHQVTVPRTSFEKIFRRETNSNTNFNTLSLTNDVRAWINWRKFKLGQCTMDGKNSHIVTSRIIYFARLDDAVQFKLMFF